MAVTHYQEKKSRQTFNSFPIFYLLAVLVLVYDLFLVTGSFYQGSRISKQLASEKDSLAQLQLEIAIAERFVVYQQTPSYLELQARENFSYIKPGETVVSLPENSGSQQSVMEEQAGQKAVSAEMINQSHLRQWLNYLF